jgi:hypothetical protein
MIAGGKPGVNEVAENIEILNLKSRRSYCNTLPSLPEASEPVVGGLALNEVPLMCNLDSLTSSRCYIFMNGMWIATDKLSEERLGASLLSFPYNDNG